MKNILLIIILFIFIPNCKLNKVENYHGSTYLNITKDEIFVNKSNKNDVNQILGPPSTTSIFDNETWIYLENAKSSSKLSKLGKRTLLKNNVLILEFDTYGILISKNYLTKKDLKKMRFTKDITSVNYSKKSLTYRLLSGLRDKINDPLGTKRIKTKK